MLLLRRNVRPACARGQRLPLNQLKIDGETAWKLDHDLPALWHWLFDPATITESRRLFTTTHDAASRFQLCAERVSRSEYFAPYITLLEEIRPDAFPRALNARPDSIVSLDLAELEKQRPYRHERAAAEWEKFFHACEQNNNPAARTLWDAAVLSPLTFPGGRQRDARAFAMRAEEFHLPRDERAKALLWLLFGMPESRPAAALTFEWTARARELPAVGQQPKRKWWRRFM